MGTYWCALAWVDGTVASNVRITAGADGAIEALELGVLPGSADEMLPGIVLPGIANVHSHAFHRVLRGRTHDGRGSFWSWRERMYEVAARLDPDSYHRLATAVYAEMAMAGVSCVGEFHYLHHAQGGRRYAEPNAMGEALRAAAREAGVRLTLIDTCYLTGGINQPLAGPQLRFGDGDADRWANRAGSFVPDTTTRGGAAIHSVRAVPPEQITTVVKAAAGRPLHVHLSEQPAENEQCATAYGRTPTQLLYDHRALGSATTAVHATHLNQGDVELLGSASTTVCFCPTTERDLADGIGPASALRSAGCSLTLGSDQHAVIDPFEEARGLEMDERLASRERGNFSADELLAALTTSGHAALGWPEAGRIAVEAPCDLAAVRLDTVRTAGVKPGQAVFAATAGDIDTVVVGGRTVVRGGEHVLGDVPRMLTEAISALVPV